MTSKNSSLSVKCPECGHVFPLDEAVLGSVRDSIQKEVSVDVTKREQSLERKLSAVSARETQLQEQTAALEKEVAKQLGVRVKEVESKARHDAVESLSAKMADLQSQLSEKAKALKAAQDLELGLRRDQRRLQEEREAFDLEMARKLDAERDNIRRQATEQVAEQNRLKVAEKEQVIENLRREMESLQRKAEQGSQQAQGEALELDFASLLRATFPLDQINDVAKGVRGADIVQGVVSPTGRNVGTILYEAKRTKAWSGGWIAKLKEDVLQAKAEMGVIITETLPAEMKRFGLVEGVWVTDYASALPLTHSLRWALHQFAIAKLSKEGAKEKMEVLYQYLTGSEFRQRLESVFEAFKSMKEDLEAEKRASHKHWSKREKQLSQVVESMACMYGDIQGLSGNALQAIPALELPN